MSIPTVCMKNQFNKILIYKHQEKYIKVRYNSIGDSYSNKWKVKAQE